MSDTIGLDRPVKCLFCDSNQDYLCDVHVEVLSNYSLTNAKLTLVVIGDSTPRINNVPDTELPVILHFSRPVDFVEFISIQLEDDQARDFRFILLLTKELIEVLTPKDILDILTFNYATSPVAIVFENSTDQQNFIMTYEAIDINLLSNRIINKNNLPIFVKAGYDIMLNFMRDGVDPMMNMFIPLSVIREYA